MVPMRKSIVICDRCKTQANVAPTHSGTEGYVPDGWANVSLAVFMHKSTTLHLCPKCVAEFSNNFMTSACLSLCS